MIPKSNSVSNFQDTKGTGSIEISVPGAFTAVGFSGQQKNPGASAAERGRPSLFKTIDEDRRERHDHINRSGRSTYPGRNSVLTSGATPALRLGDECGHFARREDADGAKRIEGAQVLIAGQGEWAMLLITTSFLSYFLGLARFNCRRFFLTDFESLASAPDSLAEHVLNRILDIAER